MTVRMSAGGDRERGSALLVTLLMTALVAAMATSLIVQSTADLALSAGFRTGAEVMQAADAGLERTIAELAPMPDWSPLLTAPPANLTAPFSEAGPTLRTPDGQALPFAGLTAALQAATPATYGPDSPLWRPYAWLPLGRLWPAQAAVPPVTLAIFVADDGEDGDGVPDTDTNGRVLVRVDAYGARRARRSVQALVERTTPS